jgi:hypothetical protein
VGAGTAFKDVVICYADSATKSSDLMLLRGGLDKYVYNCEESKLLYAITDTDKELQAAVVPVLHSLFGELLNLSSKHLQEALAKR